MIDVALYQPEIPPNTGNVMRLCANTGARLHLIHPLGFTLDDSKLKRAGLDYADWASVRQHASWQAFLQQLDGDTRLFAFTTKGQKSCFAVRFRPRDVLLFGPETRGLPNQLLAALAPDRRLRLPMRPRSRSLNLSNAVAVAVYEAWRQLDFNGAV